jgi:hypothetical protein
VRLPENTARPGVFGDGVYPVKIGDPDRDVWQVFTGQKPVTE